MDFFTRLSRFSGTLKDVLVIWRLFCIWQWLQPTVKVHARDLRIKAETSVLRLGGVSLFCPTNRECPTEKKIFRTTPPRQLFREKKFSGRIRLIPFSIQNFGHLPQNTSLSLIFSSIYQNFPHNYYFSINYVKFLLNYIFIARQACRWKC